MPYARSTAAPLPFDILHEVFENLCGSQKGLLSCLYVSKDWNNAATHKLYRDIEIDDTAKSIQKVKLLATTMSASPQLAACVRRIRRASSWLIEPNTLVLEHLGRIVSACENLESLQIYDIFPDFVDILIGKQHLKRLDVCRSKFSQDLRKVLHAITERPTFEVFGLPLMIMRFYSKLECAHFDGQESRRLRTLTIAAYDYCPSDFPFDILPSLLSVSSRLCLTLDANVVPVQHFNDSLEIWAHSLTELKLTLDRGYEGHSTPSLPVQNLTKLVNLTYLRIRSEFVPNPDVLRGMIRLRDLAYYSAKSTGHYLLQRSLRDESFLPALQNFTLIEGWDSLSFYDQIIEKRGIDFYYESGTL